MKYLIVDPLAEKYYSWSPYAYCLNNPLIYKDPTGKWVARTNGKPVTFSDKKEWSKIASADVQRIGNAMMMTSTGTARLNSMLNKNNSTEIPMVISSENKTGNSNSSLNGNTKNLVSLTKDEKVDKVVKSEITIYEKEIEKTINAANSSTPTGNARDFKGLTKEEAIGMVRGHESVHTEKDNAQQARDDRKLSPNPENYEKKPNEVGRKISNELNEKK